MVVIGDVHGKWTKLLLNLVHSELKDTNFIQVGDFGLGFYPNDLTHLKAIDEYLIQTNNHLYVIRGNHDNPIYFNKCKPSFTNIHLLSDWSYHIIEGKKGLFIGGAISIDRNTRTPNRDYWKDEAIFYPSDDFKFRDVDFVITHDCPTFINPITDKNSPIFKDNPDLYKDCLNGRKILDWIWDEIPKEKLQKWCYGHYHWSERTYVDNTAFIKLAELEMVELFFDSP